MISALSWESLKTPKRTVETLKLLLSMDIQLIHYQYQVRRKSVRTASVAVYQKWFERVCKLCK